MKKQNKNRCSLNPFFVILGEAEDNAKPRADERFRYGFVSGLQTKMVFCLALRSTCTIFVAVNKIIINNL